MLLVSLGAYCDAQAFSWTTATWQIANPLPSGDSEPSVPGGMLAVTGQPQAVTTCPITDVVGTGLPGYICPYVVNRTTDIGFVSAINTGSGFTQSNLTSGAPATIDTYSPFPNCYSGNFDGTGQRSVVCVVVSGPYTYSANSAVGSLNYLGWYHQSGYQQIQNATSAAFPGTSIASQDTSINNCMVVNVIADGMDDLACSVIYGPHNGYPSIYQEVAAYLYVATSSGFVQSPLMLGPTTSGASYLSNCLPGDFNGDGVTDFACYSNSQWNVFYSQGVMNPGGPSLAVPFTEISNSGGPSVQPGAWASPDISHIPDNCLVGDFNGDGRDDIACYQASGQWSIGLATGGNSSVFNVQTWTNGPSPMTTAPHTPGGDCWATALDGGSVSGILCYTGSGGQWSYGVWSRSSSQFTTTTVITSFTPPADYASSVIYALGKDIEVPGGRVVTQCALADFNGDGLPDIACAASGHTASMLLSVRPQ